MEPVTRVLLVAGSLPPMHCGVGAYTGALAVALARVGGMKVGVLTGEGAENPGADAGVELLTLSCNWDWRDLWRVTRAVRAWRPDVVHIQYPTQAYGEQLAPWVLPAMLRILGIPTVQTWHEFLPYQRWLRIIIALAAVRVIVVRPRYLTTLPKWFAALLGRENPKLIQNAPPMVSREFGDAERLQTKLRYAPPGKNLVVYFGFMYPHKGVEQVFEIADPRLDHLVIAGQIDSRNPYHQTIVALAGTPAWRGAASLTGHITDAEASALLASADAILFPFREGTGQWNTSVAGARTHGTFVIATSDERAGYDVETNTFFCAPDEVQRMREALREHCGRRIPASHHRTAESWKSIARMHCEVYRDLLPGRGL